MSRTTPEFRMMYRKLHAEMKRRGVSDPDGAARRSTIHFYRGAPPACVLDEPIPKISPYSAKPKVVMPGFLEHLVQPTYREAAPEYTAWPAGARQPGGGHFRGLFEWDRTQECRKGGNGTDDEGFGAWNYRMGEVVFVREMKRAFWR